MIHQEKRPPEVREKDIIKCIAAGEYHTHFLKSDNTLWATGSNSSGQLGDGTTTSRYSPVKVFTEVDSIICGGYSTFVIRNDKTLWAAGYNKYGRLGLGDTLNRKSFTQIADVNNIKAISSGGRGWYGYTMIINADGTLCGTGYNYYFSPKYLEPKTLRFTQIPDIPKMIKVCTGGNHTIALQSVNRLWGFCYNNYGQLGLGDDVYPENKFIELPGVSDIYEIVAGYYSTFIIKNDYSLWAAGLNDEGQLGDGTIINRHSFVKIMDSVITVSAGWFHTLILKYDNTLWAVGDNSQGSLGIGSIKNTATPVKVLDNVKCVATGYSHSIVLKNDNSVWGTGRNFYGQLGLGNREDRISFTEIIFK
jgi:alpha-tubulin suppressor-like RCC1 family protein